MNRRTLIPIVLFAAVALMVITCGQDKPNQNLTGGDAAVNLTFLKSSLVEEIGLVVLTVEFEGAIVLADTTTIVDGEYDFGIIEVPAGEVTFRITAHNELGAMLYYGEVTVTIVAGQHNDVEAELLPAVPMVKLSPYYADAGICDEFVGTIELYNIDLFAGGTFRIFYDPLLIEFGGTVTQADPAWGELTIMTSEDVGELEITCSRPDGSSDAVPEGVHSLVDVLFHPQRAGEADLGLLVVEVWSNIGPFVPLFFMEGQTVAITGEANLGTVSGTVTDAISDDPVAGAEVLFGETGALTTTTDQNGHYSFENLPLGGAPIGVLADGYHPGSGFADLSCENQSVTVDFQLAAQAGAATIVVLDEDGLPTPDVLVIRHTPDWNDIDSATTDVDGRAEWTVLPGMMSFHFSALAPGEGVAGRELWGQLAEAMIPPGATLTDTISRHLPFAFAVEIQDSEGTPATEFYQGETVHGIIRLDNRDIEAYVLEVFGQATRFPGETIDFQRVFTPTIAENSTDAVTFEMTPTEVGDYFVRSWKITSLIRGRRPITDSWAWPEEEAFTVLASPPDLVATAVEMDETLVAPGQSVVVSAAVDNSGAGSAGSFSILAGLNPPGWTGPAPDDIIGTLTVEAMAPGASRTFDIPGIIPSSASVGSYNVCIYVDHEQAVSETDENNNQACMAEAIDVSYPLLDVDSTSIYFAVQQYDDPPAKKQFTIANAGGGLLAWALTFGSEWMNVTPTAGGPDQSTVTVGIVDTDVPAGTYYDTIIVENLDVATDSAFVEVVYAVSDAPTGSIVVQVFDEDSQPGKIINVMRYSAQWLLIDSRTTTTDGSATWSQLPAGGSYNFLAFNTIGVGEAAELWGEALEATVTSGDTDTLTINRVFPFVDLVSIEDAQGEERTEFTTGEQVNMIFRVTNRFASALTASVQCQAALNPSGTPDYDSRSDAVSLPPLTWTFFTFTFSPETSGEYFVRPREVITEIRSADLRTDYSGWPAEASFTVAPAQPDLTVLSVSIDEESSAPGDSVTIRAEVENIGNVDSDSFYVHTFLSVDQSADVGSLDNVQLGGQNYGPLTAGGTLTCVIKSEVPVEITLGDYYGGAYVDYLENNDESDEENNSAVSADQVTIASVRPIVEPDTLFFKAWAYQDLPDSQAVTITDEAGGTLSWSALSNVEWLEVNPQAGVGSATVQAKITSTYFNPTTLYGQVVFGTTAGSDTDTLFVVYEVMMPGWTFGGSGDQQGYGVDTAVGGTSYMVVGYTNPTGAERDVYLLEVGETGGMVDEWTYDESPFFGTTVNDHGFSILKTNDNNYAIAGYTGLDPNDEYPVSYAYWLKVSPGGAKLAMGRYGSYEGFDGATGLTELSDGYLLTGYSYSCAGYDPNIGYTGCTRSSGFAATIGPNGEFDYDNYWLGWYNYSDWDELYASMVSTSGNYVCIGQTKVEYGREDAQLWTLALMSDGEYPDYPGSVAWQNNFGNPGAHDAARALVPIGGNWMVITGYSESFSNGGRDLYVFRTDGQTVTSHGWSGGSGTEIGESIVEVEDGYVVSGFTDSFGAGGADVYVVKFDINCNVLWSKTYGGPGNEYGRGIVVTRDGGFMVVGVTDSYGLADKEVWVLRLNADGTIWEAP